MNTVAGRAKETRLKSLAVATDTGGCKFVKIFATPEWRIYFSLLQPPVSAPVAADGHFHPLPNREIDALADEFYPGVVA